MSCLVVAGSWKKECFFATFEAGRLLKKKRHEMDYPECLSKRMRWQDFRLEKLRRSPQIPAGCEELQVTGRHTNSWLVNHRANEVGGVFGASGPFPLGNFGVRA